MLNALAPYAALLVLFTSGLSFVGGRRRVRLLDAQSGVGSIRQLSWQEFEQLVGEYFRRLGYTVRETGQRGHDGGVDLELRQDGQLYLVQCKHWKAWKVGVPVVWEMLALYGVGPAHLLDW
jgi:restriction system protein